MNYMVIPLAVCVLWSRQVSAVERFVALSGSHISPFTNWSMAATNIQAAIDATFVGDTVWVSNGVYNVGGRSAGYLTNRVDIRKAIRVQSVNGADGTVIEGAGPRGPNAVRCAYVGAGAILSGFTLRGGATRTEGDWFEDRSGGGIMLVQNGTVELCRITANLADSVGGGIAGYGVAQNCAIFGNKARSEGSGAAYITARHCTVCDNEIENLMAAYGGGTSGGFFLNCIVYYNRRGSAEDNYPSAYPGTYQYTCTRPSRAGTGIITNEPGLVSFTNPRLMASSPCINRGAYAYATSDTDFEGDPRIWGDGPDLGCDEYFTPSITGALAVTIGQTHDRVVAGTPIKITSGIDGKPRSFEWRLDGRALPAAPVQYYTFTNAGSFDVVLYAWNSAAEAAATSRFHVFWGYTNYVALGGLGVWPYTNRTQAATTIQDAVSANIPGGVTRVAPGDYATGDTIPSGILPCRVAITNPMHLISEDGPAVTRIIGAGPIGPNAVRCAFLANGVSMAGFELRGGETFGLDAGSLTDQCGGGAWCEGQASISNCWIMENTALYDGGGVCGGVVYASRISGNTAGRDGGGLWRSTVYKSLIISNQSGWSGGGSSGGGSHQSWYESNHAGISGGGLSSAQANNCLVIGNRSEYGGGLAYSVGRHLTVVENYSEYNGGGLYRCQVTNAIVYFNTAGDSWENYYNSICSYTCTGPDPEAMGSIDADPLFVNTAGDDFRLQHNSPCIDAGQSNSLTYDINDAPRPLDGRGAGVACWDMGAYEFSRFRYVATNGGNRWPFSTWADAARTIQSAVDSAVEGDVIWVSNGVYSTGGRAWGGALTNRVVVDKSVTIQSAVGFSNTVIRGAGPLGPAAVRGVWLGAGAVLSGFTITNGHTMEGVGLEAERVGGGLYCEPGAIVSNCWLSGNRAVMGGGLARGGAYNCVVAGNQAETDGGGAWLSYLEHSAVVANTAGGEGGGVFDSTVRNSVVYFNNPGNYHDGDWRYSCTTPEPSGGVAMITADPRFEDMASNDYRLAVDSPCIDSAEPNNQVVDLAGVGRPLDGRNLGSSAWDMGAYEYVHPLADSDGDGLLDMEEVDVFQTNPARADTDGDGQNDREEIVAGTDPRSATSFFAVQFAQILDGAVLWGWPSVTGRLYTVMTSETVDGTWSNRADGYEWAGTGQELVYTNRSDHPYGRLLLRKP